MQKMLDQGFSRTLLLVQEFVRTEAGEYRIPIDYKFHMFRGKIGAILALVPGRTRNSEETTRTYFTEDWQRTTEPIYFAPEGSEREPPACFKEMKQVARALGAAYETYVRVDLYATDKGCVFGEFTAVPGMGRKITAFGDTYFEKLCVETFPDGI